MPGYWEFPGGKCHPGELPEACVARECQEEVGLPIVVDRLRRVVEHVYPHGHVELYFFDCRTEEPGAEPRGGTGFCWVEARRLASFEFPAGNDAIVAELIALGPSQ
jgi:mutator protein MutT